jgi:hypothetical protein
MNRPTMNRTRPDTLLNKTKIINEEIPSTDGVVCAYYLSISNHRQVFYTVGSNLSCFGKIGWTSPVNLS